MTEGPGNESPGFLKKSSPSTASNASVSRTKKLFGNLLLPRITVPLYFPSVRHILPSPIRIPTLGAYSISPSGTCFAAIILLVAPVSIKLSIADASVTSTGNR